MLPVFCQCKDFTVPVKLPESESVWFQRNSVMNLMKSWIRQTSIHNVSQQCYVVYRKCVYCWNRFIFLLVSVSYRFTRAAWSLSFECGRQDWYSASVPLKVVNRRLSLRMKLCSLYVLCIFHNGEKYRASPWPLLHPSWVCVSITCSVSHASAHVGASVLRSGRERLIDCSLKAWTL